MAEYAATNALTAGLSQALPTSAIKSMLGVPKYVASFTKSLTIATTAQLFSMSVGLSKKLNINMVFEQALGQTFQEAMTDQFHFMKAPSTVKDLLGSTLDDLEGMTVGDAFGYHADAATLATNFMGDFAQDKVDALARQLPAPQATNTPNDKALLKQMQNLPNSFNNNGTGGGNRGGSGSGNRNINRNRNGSGNRNAGVYPYSANDNDYNNPIPNPTCFTDQALQTETDFITQSLNEDAQQTNFNNAFYSGMRHNLNEAFSEMDESSDHAQEAVNDHHYVQQRSERVVNAGARSNPGLFTRAGIDTEEFGAGFANGFYAAGCAAADGLGYAIVHPVNTAIGLYSAITDGTKAGLHFAAELMNASTRPEAMAELKEEIKSTDSIISSDWNEAKQNPEFAGNLLGHAAFAGAGMFVGGEAIAASRVGLFGANAGDGVAAARLVARSERVSSDSINKNFIDDDAIAAGWSPPYPDGVSLRKISLNKNMIFYRVHTQSDWPYGRFMARQEEIAPFLNDPESLRVHLGLPDQPLYITEVRVPAGTEMYAGRIGPQPNFGLMQRSGFQYQALRDLPRSSFINTRPILQPGLNFNQ